MVEDKGLQLTRKRILSELRELAAQELLLDVPFNETKEECGVRLSPMSSNLLEWHFSFTGVQDSSFAGGIYHGRIRLHPEYPRKAPSISMLTPTGRWEVGKEICLSASAYHQETWDTSWNLRTLVLSLRNFILTQPREIGGILTTGDHQRGLAAASRAWVCPGCRIRHADLLPRVAAAAASVGVGACVGVGADTTAEPGAARRPLPLPLPRSQGRSRLILSSSALLTSASAPASATAAAAATTAAAAAAAEAQPTATAAATARAARRRRGAGRGLLATRGLAQLSAAARGVRVLVLGALVLLALLNALLAAPGSAAR